MFVLLGTMSSAVSSAQTRSSFEIGGHIATTTLRQFDGNDVGIGVRAGWHPAAILGLEGELTVYPSNFPDRFPFTRSRTEGLFGLTIGPTFGRVGTFGRVRPGFVTFAEALVQPFPCIRGFFRHRSRACWGGRHAVRARYRRRCRGLRNGEDVLPASMRATAPCAIQARPSTRTAGANRICSSATTSASPRAPGCASR